MCHDHNYHTYGHKSFQLDRNSMFLHKLFLSTYTIYLDIDCHSSDSDTNGEIDSGYASDIGSGSKNNNYSN
ncbi:Hypothetical predicted protein [Octopus vulgaris]|uniref:Uncharacterized protein n=1 Tax=Octopus vulgaris TaxID=6645 RepID=A0AA36F7Z0_OCTVU|nr:Hypothetical predicted protein [Octopus vulgaris]